MNIRVDESGTWEDDGQVSILVEPSSLWIQQNIERPTREEKLVHIRAKRDALLDECDTKYCNAERWELMPEEEKVLWRTYKQDLRDLPDLIDDNEIDNPIWPTLPGLGSGA